MQLLALDFDGVLSDSAPEAFVVALRTYLELQPESRLRETPCAERAGAPAREGVEADPLYRGFVGHMPLGNRAEDFAVVLRALEAHSELPDQAAYDAFRERQDAAWLRAYHKRFYQVRAALSRAEPRGWLALMAPYAAFLTVLRRRAGDALLAIATAKDRRSVGALLEAYGVADLFPEDRVLDKETGVTKAAHLEHLHRSLGVPYPEITFLDDKANHLHDAAGLGVRCGLAAWGYNGAREVALARECGYLVLLLDDVEAQLFGAGV